jgi:hypothetical protein
MGDGHDEIDLSLYGLRSACDGGLLFCGVSEQQFAINGTTYQWPRGSHITWGLGFSRLGQLSDLDCKGAIHDALLEISGCCGITHAYAANFRSANVLITAQRLDGRSGVLADMQIPTGNVNANTQLLGRCDDGEEWTIAENPARGAVDFYRVILHELLHAHGLGHGPVDRSNPALIEPTYSTAIRNLQPRDKAELVRRYGPARTPQPPVGPPAVGDSVGVEVIIRQADAQFKIEGQAKRI